MRALMLIVIASLMNLNAQHALAARRHDKYNRPTISLPPFTVSYGKVTTVCGTANPPRKASVFLIPTVWRNASNAPDVFRITPGTDAACTGDGKVFLTVESRTDIQCLTQGRIRAVLKNRGAFYEAGSAVGTVLIPTQEVAKLKSNSSSQGSINAEWRITFSDAGGTADFNGLTAAEDLFIWVWLLFGDIHRRPPEPLRI